MSDDAFTRVPDQWSPDEAIERQLAAAAESPVPPSLRQTTMQAMGRQLRQTRAEGAWLLAAWLMIAALGWMLLSSTLSHVSTLPRQAVVAPAAPKTEPDAPSSFERTLRVWSRFLLPRD